MAKIEPEPSAATISAPDLRYYARCTCENLSKLSVADHSFAAMLKIAVAVRSTGQPLDLKEVQQPLMVLNSDDAKLEETARWLMPDGSAVIMMGAVGTFRSQFDARRFPFETLTCSIVISCTISSLAPIDTHVSEHKLTATLDSSAHPESGHTQGSHVVLLTKFFMEGDMYTYLGSEYVTSTSDPTESASGKAYDAIEFRYRLQRRPQYFIWNILVPTFALTSLNFIAFAFPPSELSDRLSVTLTIMLTTAAYKFTVADKLPPVAYLTLADIYVLACFALTMLLAVENALVKNLPPHVDSVACVALAVVWVAFNVVMIGVFVGTRLRSGRKMIG